MSPGRTQGSRRSSGFLHLWKKEMCTGPSSHSSCICLLLLLLVLNLRDLALGLRTRLETTRIFMSSRSLAKTHTHRGLLTGNGAPLPYCHSHRIDRREQEGKDLIQGPCWGGEKRRGQSLRHPSSRPDSCPGHFLLTPYSHCIRGL